MHLCRRVDLAKIARYAKIASFRPPKTQATCEWSAAWSGPLTHSFKDQFVGVKKTGKGRRKLGRKKRRMRARIRHRKK